MVQALLGTSEHGSQGPASTREHGWERLLGFGLFAALHFSTAPASRPSASHSCRDGVRHCRRNDEVSAWREGRPFKIASIQPLRETALRLKAISRTRFTRFTRFTRSITPIPPSAWRRDSSCTSKSLLLLALLLPVRLCWAVTLRYVYRRCTSTSPSPLSTRGRRLTRRLSSKWLEASVP
jgi:hypothetical protein